jgi:hypothetical protein
MQTSAGHIGRETLLLADSGGARARRCWYVLGFRTFVGHSVYVWGTAIVPPRAVVKLRPSTESHGAGLRCWAGLTAGASARVREVATAPCAGAERAVRSNTCAIADGCGSWTFRSHALGIIR